MSPMIEFMPLVHLAMALCHAAIWLMVAGLGLWRVRLAFPASALLISAGLLGAGATVLAPAIPALTFFFASPASTDAALGAAMGAAVLNGLASSLAWLILLTALWRLLRDLRPSDPPPATETP